MELLSMKTNIRASTRLEAVKTEIAEAVKTYLGTQAAEAEIQTGVCAVERAFWMAILMFRQFGNCVEGQYHEGNFCAKVNIETGEFSLKKIK
jgi:hypothetical protein